MALISSVSMTLIVKGTLQSEFLTMFCPMRLMYSVTTGSVMNFVLFSSCMAYDLPILISDSVEYQLPTPRAPILRVPTALTSSMLPAFTPGMLPSAFGVALGGGAAAAGDAASGVDGGCCAAGAFCDPLWLGTVGGVAAGGVDCGEGVVWEGLADGVGA